MSDWWDEHPPAAAAGSDWWDEHPPASGESLTSGKGPAGIASAVTNAITGNGAADAVRRGATQGATLGFGDEITGAISAPILKLIGKVSGDPTYQEAFGDKPMLDLYRQSRDRERTGNEQAQKDHADAYLGGELGGAVLSSFAPGVGALNLSKGAKLGEAVLKNAALGGLTGLGGSEADLTNGEVGRAALDTGLGAGIGGALGAATHGVGQLVGKAGARAAAKVADIDESAARAAQAEAAAGTASARSAAGTAAQDAYKQLEHLRELDRLGQLTPEQKAVADSLSEELGQKAQDKILSSAERKAATAEAYKRALEDEGQRAEAIASDKLGTGELKRQTLARLKRYGIPAALGAAAGGLGFGGHGMMAGAAIGGAFGNNFRPMMHSMLRLAKSPVVQRAIYGALSHASSAAPAADAIASRMVDPAVQHLDPELEALVNALRAPPQYAQGDK